MADSWLGAVPRSQGILIGFVCIFLLYNERLWFFCGYGSSNFLPEAHICISGDTVITCVCQLVEQPVNFYLCALCLSCSELIQFVSPE